MLNCALDARLLFHAFQVRVAFRHERRKIILDQSIQRRVCVGNCFCRSYNDCRVVSVFFTRTTRCGLKYKSQKIGGE